ncbi:MAG: peptidoglycan DD-metalloendopeptidase family protein [Christensenellales bacterium]|jgi:murein DD-endopeptidase MepM/ murein hydrolase activator NlpD
MDQHTLQAARRAEAERIEKEKAKRRQKRKKGLGFLAGALLFVSCCLIAFTLIENGLFADAAEMDHPVSEVASERTHHVLSIDLVNGEYRTVTLSDGSVATLEDYESEYVQFGLGDALILPAGVIDETGEDVSAVLDTPNYDPLLDIPPTPTPLPLPEEYEAQTADYSPATMGEGEYAAVSVDDVIVCFLASRADYEWVMEKLLNGCGSKEDAKVTNKGTVENICAYFQQDEPADVYTREEAYLLLADSVTLRWTETATATERVEPSTLYQEDPTLEKGKTKVKDSGRNGKVKKTYEVTYEGGKIVDKKLVAQKVVEEAEPKIVLKGTKAVSSSSSSSGKTTTTPASGTGGYWPGTTIGKGVDYPNIDTTKTRPDRPDYGIMGPSTGSLSFVWPTEKQRVSSYFGWRYGRMHYGVDIFDKRGSSIVASESGTVTSYTGTRSGYGLIVEISHGNGYTTRYAHLESILVSVGDRVVRGQLIGTMGDSGTTDSEPHCHFEIRCDGVPYNPMFYLP